MPKIDRNAEVHAFFNNMPDHLRQFLIAHDEGKCPLTHREGVEYLWYVHPRSAADPEEYRGKKRGCSLLSTDNYTNWWIVPSYSKANPEDLGPYETLQEAVGICIIVMRLDGVPITPWKGDTPQTFGNTNYELFNN